MNAIMLTNEELEMVNGGNGAGKALDYAGFAIGVVGAVAFVAGAPVIVTAAIVSVGLHVGFLAISQHIYL